MIKIYHFQKKEAFISENIVKFYFWSFSGQFRQKHGECKHFWFCTRYTSVFSIVWDLSWILWGLWMSKCVYELKKIQTKKEYTFDKSSKFGFPTIWPSVCAGPGFLWYWQWPVLSQVVNAREEMVTYGSRMLNTAEQNQNVLHKGNYSLSFMHWYYRLTFLSF